MGNWGWWALYGRSVWVVIYLAWVISPKSIPRLVQCCCWLVRLLLDHGRVGVGLKSVQALLKVPIIKMLQREVGGGKQFRGVQPPLCTATAVFTTAQYENSGNIHFTKWKMKKLYVVYFTPARTLSISGLKSRVLKLPFLDSRPLFTIIFKPKMVKSRLEILIHLLKGF